MALLHIVTLGFCFVLSLTESSNCLPDDPTEICSGFTTTNDPILTTQDSCAAPPNRNITVRPCGRERISYDDCYRAGCCYQSGECYLPLVEERVDYLFFSEKVRYREAFRECRKAGWYKLPCVVDDFDYKRVRSRSCGNVWLGGAATDRNAAPKVPFYKQKSGDCSSKIGVSCKLFPEGYALALESANNDAYFLSIVNTSETRPFLCIKEEWRSHIKTYPDNVSAEDRNKLMLCGLTFSGNVTAQNLFVDWKLYYPNGTKTRLKAKKYENKRQVAAQYYADSIRAEVPGKYVCSFTFLDKEGVSTKRTSWAYHHTNISCNVSVHGTVYSSESVIELRAEYNSDIIISLICAGYPLPEIHWTIDVNGQGPVTKPTAQSGDNLTISKLETQAPLHEDVTYTVNLQPKSDVTSLPNTTIRITKLPIPTECSVTLVMGVEEVFQIPQPSVQRQVDVRGSFDVVFLCSGYPKPNMTALKITTTADQTAEENLTPDITNLVAQWFFDDFATEVLPSEDYIVTLNMTVTPPGQQPYTFTLQLTKQLIPTSCTFHLISNGTVIEEHSALDVRHFHRVNESSFADQSFELNVSCTGFPAPEIRAVILTEKEDTEPTEKTIGPSQEHFNWKLNSFASEAAVAQDYSQTLTLTTKSGEHPTVEMVLKLVKTIIKFDVDIPAGVLTVEAPEDPVENGTVGDTEPVVGKITLPCKGASGPSFPTPSAFWEFNDKRLDITEMGEHIEFKYEEKSDIDSTIVITTQSSIVAGVYRCVILIDNKFTNNYTTLLKVKLPPIPPGPTLITEIVGTERVHAASFLPPSYQYLGNNISFTGFLFSGDTILDEINDTTVSEGKVHGVFTVPSGSGMIRVGFKASNEHGDSELSQKSDELEIFPDTPRSSVTKIERDKQTKGDTFSTLSLKFNEIPDVDKYEVRLFNSDGTLVKVFEVIDNKTVIDELEPETGYSIEVRGVNMVDGKGVYGPNSLASSFTTAPHELPAPSNLQGQPLESDGNKSAVLLTWDAAKVSAEFIDVYLLHIRRPEDKSEDTDSLRRRRRQALQTFKPVRIPFGARAKVIKGLESGTRYEFILKSYSSDFGESKPATVTVQTLTAGPCPYTRSELYPPRHCPPRVSMDRGHLYIKFYFDCYSGDGLDFRGKHSATHKGECAAWTEENLRQFRSENLPEIGTNYCRNIESSRKDSSTLHDKPWCYLPDGSNETCSVRPCHNMVDETCYQDNGYTFRGLGYSEECAPWREEVLEQHLISQYPQQILGSRACRNWEGSNMTKPWCFTIDGAKAECPAPPCGTGQVTFESGVSTTQYTVTESKDYVCIPLDQSQRVGVGVKHTFGMKNCQSDEIYPEIIIPPKIRTTDRLWVRYLLVEIILMVLVVSLWLFLLYRKRIITRQSSLTNGRTVGTNLDTKRGTTSTRLSYTPTSR